MGYVITVLGWASSNVVALVAGGYIGYRYGDKIEGWVRHLLGYAVKP